MHFYIRFRYKKLKTMKITNTKKIWSENFLIYGRSIYTLKLPLDTYFQFFLRTLRRIRRVKSVTPQSQGALTSPSALGTPKRSQTINRGGGDKESPSLSGSEISSILSSVTEDRKSSSPHQSPFRAGEYSEYFMDPIIYTLIVHELGKYCTLDILQFVKALAGTIQLLQSIV